MMVAYPVYKTTVIQKLFSGTESISRLSSSYYSESRTRTSVNFFGGGPETLETSEFSGFSSSSAKSVSTRNLSASGFSYNAAFSNSNTRRYEWASLGTGSVTESATDSGVTANSGGSSSLKGKFESSFSGMSADSNGETTTSGSFSTQAPPQTVTVVTTAFTNVETTIRSTVSQNQFGVFFTTNTKTYTTTSSNLATLTKTTKTTSRTFSSFTTQKIEAVSTANTQIVTTITNGTSSFLTYNDANEDQIVVADTVYIDPKGMLFLSLTNTKKQGVIGGYFFTTTNLQDFDCITDYQLQFNKSATDSFTVFFESYSMYKDITEARDTSSLYYYGGWPEFDSVQAISVQVFAFVFPWASAIAEPYEDDDGYERDGKTTIYSLKNKTLASSDTQFTNTYFRPNGSPNTSQTFENIFSNSFEKEQFGPESGVSARYSTIFAGTFERSGTYYSSRTVNTDNVVNLWGGVIVPKKDAAAFAPANFDSSNTSYSSYAIFMSMNNAQVTLNDAFYTALLNDEIVPFGVPTFSGFQSTDSVSSNRTTIVVSREGEKFSSSWSWNKNSTSMESSSGTASLKSEISYPVGVEMEEGGDIHGGNVYPNRSFTKHGGPCVLLKTTYNESASGTVSERINTFGGITSTSAIADNVISISSAVPLIHGYGIVIVSDAVGTFDLNS
jgi:hypothetical protein